MLLSLKAFKDNYIWLYSNDLVNFLAVDPGDAEPVIQYFTENSTCKLEAVLLTHHHADHSGGLQELLQSFPALPIYSSFEGEIKGATHILPYTDQIIQTQHFKIQAIACPGHTLGHFCYLVDNHLFSGDTLFSFGCGRVFEGTYQQMFDTLNKLKQLPDETKLCAGHEYTIANLDFVKTIAHLSTIATKMQTNLIAKGNNTLPSTMQIEKSINPFLLAKTVAEFESLRKAKDSF